MRVNDRNPPGQVCRPATELHVPVEVWRNFRVRTFLITAASAA